MELRVINEMLADERDGLLRRGREEGREEERDFLRSSLTQIISQKYPTIDAAEILERLRDIKSRERLQRLLLQVLKDLSWDEFWKSPSD